MSRLPKIPPSLLQTTGEVQFGRYLGEINVDFLRTWDAQKKLRRRIERKAWIYFGLFHEDFILGFAMADTGYIGLCFCYYYDRKQKAFLEEKKMKPLGFPTAFSPTALTPWSFGSGNKAWKVTPTANHWDVEFSGKAIRLTARFEKMLRGITAVARAKNRPFNATYKLAGIPVTGEIEVRGAKTKFSAQGAVDLTLGYPARKTFWHWACLCGTTSSGETVGMNLVAHFNQGLENAVFTKAETFGLGEVTFTPGKRPAVDIWRVTNEEDQIAITFTPEGARSENLNLIAVRDRFVQVFGKFEAEVNIEGRLVRFAGTGVVEEHFAVW